MKAKPNILFFFTDDQRFDTLGALSRLPVQTPHLDQLARDGTVFTQAHIPGGTCPAVCMPSRAMLHTGRTLFHLEREGQEIPDAHITLGECLRQAGYTTCGIGKWHNGRRAYARSFSGGAKIFLSGMGDHWNVPVYDFDPAGRYAGRWPYVPDPFYKNRLEFRECDHIAAGKHSTDLFVDAAIEFLRSDDGARPFFLYVSLMAPHDPRTMPEKFRQMYDPAQIELPANFAAEHAIDTGALRIRDELLAAFPRRPDEIRRHLAEYYAMISHLDDAFGRLMSALRASGRYDQTIIVFASDNGLALGQHGLMGKQSLYDHSVRVPLVFAGPGIPRGERRDQLVYLLDIFPTFCELAGLAPPASVEGRSLGNCLRDAAGQGRPELYLAYEKSIRGISDSRYKLIEYAGGATQLFDRQSDPWEMHNLAADNSSRSVLAERRQKLAALAAEWDDQNYPAGSDFWQHRPDLKP
ncbi:MAG: sulfatase-like hydrolase/transferase [Lentisphaerae bacterium]|nr:sulfatase-like hydrolase/transferase [Lentisphaerota bacterium]